MLGTIGNLLNPDGSGPSDDGFVVVSPEDGEVVDSDLVEVRGTAPAGAEIVLDIAFAPDDRTQADDDGDWSLPVELDEGSNAITLRLGDDEETEITLHVIYEPSTAEGPSATPRPSMTTAAATPVPTPALTPAPQFATFGEGDQRVGVDIQPGTYRTRQTPILNCYWERLSGFGGTFGEIISNGNSSGYVVVAIAASDAGFSSSGCGQWSSNLAAVPNPPGQIAEDGIYMVRVDMAPGTWRSSGAGGTCYTARLSGFGGTFNEIISNNLSEGPSVVTIAGSDVGFETHGCGIWTQ